MFDIGWSELLVLGAIALIVVGPKDLPGMLRTLGQMAGKAKRMAREFQRTLEDAADESGMGDLKDVQKSMKDWNRKIGGDAPRKYAESFLNGGKESGKAGKTGKAGETPAPAPGSHDAADAAENAAWQAEQASKAQAEAAAAPSEAPSPAPTSAPAPASTAEPTPAPVQEQTPKASRSA